MLLIHNVLLIQFKKWFTVLKYDFPDYRITHMKKYWEIFRHFLTYFFSFQVFLNPNTDGWKMVFSYQNSHPSLFTKSDLSQKVMLVATSVTQKIALERSYRKRFLWLWHVSRWNKFYANISNWDFQLYKEYIILEIVGVSKIK